MNEKVVVIILLLVIVFSCVGRPNRKKQGGRPPVRQTRSCMTNQNEGKEELPDYKDYTSYMMTQTLEPEIFRSHSDFAKDLKSRTSNISVHQINSGDTYDVPWVGLRRPSLNVPIGKDARVIPGSKPEEHLESSRYSCTGLF